MAACIFPIFHVSDAQWFLASCFTFQMIHSVGAVIANLVSRNCTERVNGVIFGDYYGHLSKSQYM